MAKTTTKEDKVSVAEDKLYDLLLGISDLAFEYAELGHSAKLHKRFLALTGKLELAWVNLASAIAEKE